MIVMSVLFVAMFGTFVSTASAAVTIDELMVQIVALQDQLQMIQGGGGGTSTSSTSPSWLSQYFDFGDVRGGYSTNIDGNVNMNAYLSASSGVITSCNTSVYKQGWMDVEGRTYFQVNVNFSGNYDSLPTDTNGLNQSNQASHRGVTINENSGLYSYQEWQSGDIDVPTGPFWSNGNGNVALSPFTVTNVDGNFRDNTWIDTWNNITHNDFSYNVNWSGYTEDAVAAGMFGTIAPTTIPEPATMSLLAIGAIGLIARRHKKQ